MKLHRIAGRPTIRFRALASTAFAVSAMLLRGDLEFNVAREQCNNAAIFGLFHRIDIVPSDEGKNRTRASKSA